MADNKVMFNDLDGMDPAARETQGQHCCETMSAAVSTACDLHPDRRDCPDALVEYRAESNQYGLLIHDGGTASMLIQFCPWCGSRLLGERSKA